MYKNYFITFEGIDGAGKDTQLNYLVESIRDDNINIFGNKYSNIWITREPTKITEYGIKISNMLKNNKITKEEATHLFISDRIEHSKIIRNMLNHSHVICSRYDLSTFSYQMSQGANFEELYKLHKYNSHDGTLIPDLTIFIDITIDEAMKRINKRNSDKEFFETKNFLQQTINNTFYCIDKLKRLDNRKILIINGNYDPETIKYNIFNNIKKYLPEYK